MKITSVPEYLFGSATYATPIRFEIVGVDRAWIRKIEATLIWKSCTQSNSIDISTRFVAVSPTGVAGPEQNNGSSKCYEAYVPASFYADKLLNLPTCDHRDWEAGFTLKVDFEPVIGGGIFPLVTDALSERSAPPPAPAYPNAGRIKVFADARLTCVELPVTVTGQIPAAVPKTIDLDDASQQLAARRNGLTTFKQYQISGPAGPITIPERDAYTPLDGFHNSTDEASATASMSVAMMQARTRLYDDTDYIDTSGTRAAYQARAYGLRNGGYFYVSYGGKTVVPVSEPVMDLGKFSGNFELDLFSGTHSVELKCINSGALNVSSAGTGAAAFGFLWAISPAGQWAMAFGTASSIFTAIAAVDTDGAAGMDRADGCAFWITSRNSVADTPAAPAAPIVQALTVSSTNGTAYTHDLRLPSQACNTGDQWTFALDLDSSVNAEAKPVVTPIFGAVTSVDCLSDVRYTASSAADLRDMKVTTHP